MLKVARSRSDTSLVEVRRRLALVPGQFATAPLRGRHHPARALAGRGWVADDARIVDLHNSVIGHALRDSDWIRLMVVLVASTLFGAYLAHGCNRPHRLRWHITALLAAVAAFIYTLTEAEWAVSQSLLLNVEPGIGPTLAAWGAIGLAVGEVVAFAAFLVSRLGSGGRDRAGRGRRRRPHRAVAARRCAGVPSRAASADASTAPDAASARTRAPATCRAPPAA